jgi:outer membrane protein TolC
MGRAETVRTLVNVGRADSVDVAKAKLDIQQVQTDLARAELELALIQVQRRMPPAKSGGS